MCKKNKDKEKVGFFGEFKAFITRGNVIDLAVGVIIGGAFTAIVTALSDKILRPLINGVIYWIGKACGAGEGDPLSAMYTYLVVVKDAEGKIDLAKSTYIDWGAFISAIINFLLVAFILFLIVKGINKVHKASEEAKKLVADKLAKEEKVVENPEEAKSEENK